MKQEKENIKHKRKRGFTLLEVIVAIFILTVGAGASFALIQQTLVASSLIEFKLIASYLAQEGIEIVRNIRDTNWLQEQRNIELAKSSPWDDGLCDLPPLCEWQADYTTITFADTQFDESCADANHYNCHDYNPGSFLYIDGNTGFYRYIAAPGPNDTQTIFKRKISITPEVDKIRVLIEVEWEERGRSHSFKALEYITNWYE